MSGIFDEQNMIQVLGRYLPSGESLRAGVHGVGVQIDLKQVYKNCSVAGNLLIPDKEGITLEVHKRKVSKFDVYAGITEHYLLLSECEECGYRYELTDVSDKDNTPCETLETEILLDHIGTAIPLADIRNCEVKNGIFGSVNCMVTLKNGSFLKHMIPKKGGLGGGMPHHEEHREIILNCLCANSAGA